MVWIGQPSALTIVRPAEHSSEHSISKMRMLTVVGVVVVVVY